MGGNGQCIRFSFFSKVVIRAKSRNALGDPKEKENILCELNVIRQVTHVFQSSMVRNAWKSKQELTVHGWVYNIEDGFLKDLNVSVNNLISASRIMDNMKSKPG